MEQNEEKKKTSKTKFLKHLGFATATMIFLIYAVFKFYFPLITNHGESMTVPNLEGISLADLDEYLEERDLRYEIEEDSGYSAQYPPLTVLKQFPMANSKVKQGRKIYITLNAVKPPVVKIPSLKGRSLKNAQLELRSLGLELGEIRYQPDFALNTILAQYHEGKAIQAGQEIAKGSIIDFEVGDGLGNQNFQMLNLKNLSLDEAIFVLRGFGLNVGDVYYEKSGHISTQYTNDQGETAYKKETVNPGKVFKQNPASDMTARIGQSIDLWVVEIDSAALGNTPSLELAE
ncbi:PASTA domain-containing protein [Reichenbachiella agarivorans]|uniref:PASTA domain-containing protein n=1 Tax=Reichenbachiella agarivorans TaxID=2979464 RepID=A0ABY6CQ13_9BACT|nr:PASTA domain-containing protein [Reichenbachiella agarivorans]UXP31438.1 PASTA domain-containing protein [Reichenbachiella agarivorans]